MYIIAIKSLFQVSDRIIVYPPHTRLIKIYILLHIIITACQFY